MFNTIISTSICVHWHKTVYNKTAQCKQGKDEYFCNVAACRVENKDISTGIRLERVHSPFSLLQQEVGATLQWRPSVLAIRSLRFDFRPTTKRAPRRLIWLEQKNLPQTDLTSFNLKTRREAKETIHHRLRRGTGVKRLGAPTNYHSNPDRTSKVLSIITNKCEIENLLTARQSRTHTSHGEPRPRDQKLATNLSRPRPTAFER